MHNWSYLKRLFFHLSRWKNIKTKKKQFSIWFCIFSFCYFILILFLLFNWFSSISFLFSPPFLLWASPANQNAHCFGRYLRELKALSMWRYYPSKFWRIIFLLKIFYFKNILVFIYKRLILIYYQYKIFYTIIQLNILISKTFKIINN